MLDRYAVKLIKAPLDYVAKHLDKAGLNANQITLSGFVLGLAAIPMLAFQHYDWALGLIILNRIFDGLDGALARRQGCSDFGGYLDIVCDFIFYSGVVLGFALAAPEQNSIAANVLIWTFMGTGSSFLTFAIMAAKRDIENTVYPHKSLYYLGGLTEGSETIALFLLFCIYPEHFPTLALGFAALCFITTLTRILAAKATFIDSPNQGPETPKAGDQKRLGLCLFTIYFVELSYPQRLKHHSEWAKSKNKKEQERT